MVHRPSLIICSLLVALLLPTRPARGEGCPAARITFESGRVIHAEILSFANGRFQLRDTQTGKKFAALDDDIESIEFGKVPVGVAPAKKPEPAATAKKPKPAATAKKPKPITPPEKPKPWQPTGETTAFWRVVEQGDHEKLTWRIISMTRLKGNESVLAFEGELLARMRERDITREKRRDMQLALAVAYFCLGEQQKGLAQIAEVGTIYADDKKVARFLKLHQELAGGKAAPLWETVESRDYERLFWRAAWMIHLKGNQEERRLSYKRARSGARPHRDLPRPR